MTRNMDRYVFLRFNLRLILDRYSLSPTVLRFGLACFLVRKRDKVIDGGLPAGAEFVSDPPGLPQLFPCPLD